MNQKEIHDLIKLVNKTDITEVKIKDGDFNITIKSGSDAVAMMPTMVQAAPAMAAAPIAAPAQTSTPAQDAPAAAKETAKADDDSKYTVFKSPMVGTFYRKPAPEKPVFFKVGDTIKTGDVLCIIEAMKLFNEIEAEIEGTVVKVLLDDSSPVEYDQ
ncbi:MAG: acetyl-CoA carboxylase biotin carboxyl carrier protein, partial [Chitinophagales bacterium]